MTTSTRRGVLFAGVLGAAGLLSAAPALAADSPWTQKFLTAHEDRMGWDVGAVTDTQADNARLIIAIGKGHDIDSRGIQVALTTAIVESWLYNRYTITDGTSGGLFQQQTSWGWGSFDEVRNKALATRAFFGVADHTSNPGLVDAFPNGVTGSIGAAAQSVQGSAYPQRYVDAAPDAATLYERYAADVAPFRG